MTGTLRPASSFGALLLGCSIGISLVTSIRVSLWRRNSRVLDEFPELASTPSCPNRETALFFGPALRSRMTDSWNQGVIDRIAKPAIQFMADRGW